MAQHDIGLRITASAAGAKAAFAQVQGALEGLGKASGRALDPLTSAVARATGGVRELGTSLRPLQRELSGLGASARQAAGRAFDGVSASAGRLRAQLGGMIPDLRGVSGLLSSLGGAASAAGLVAMARGIGTAARELQTLSTQSNTSVETFQRLAFGAKSVGIEQGKLGDILKDTQDKVGDFLSSGGGEMAEFFERIAPRVGVTAESFRNLSGPDALQLYVDSLEKANLSQSEMVFFMEAIADESSRLLPLLRNSGEGMRALGEEAELAGIIMGAELVAKGVELDRTLQVLEAHGRGLAIALGSVVVPALNEVAKALLELARTDMSVFDRIYSTIFRGFDDPNKDPAAEIARLKKEIEAFQNADWAERSLLGNLAPEKVMGDLVAQLDFWQAKRDAAGQPTAGEQEGAKKRAGLERALAEEIGRLEKLRAVSAGQANADILLSDRQMQQKRVEEARKAVNEQINGVEALKTALSTAWDGAIAGARRAREEAAALLQQAADARQGGIDKATDRRLRGLSEDDRSAAARREARDLRDKAGTSAARAVIKAYEGDLKGAQRLAEEAAKQAERAERFADMVTDDDTAANLFEELGRIREQALQAQARIKQQEATAQDEQAQGIQQQIALADERLAGLKAELAKPVSIELDITAAVQKIQALQNQLNALNASAAGGSGATQGDLRKLDAVAGATPDARNVEVTAETQAAEGDLAEVQKAVDAIPEKKTIYVETVQSNGTRAFSDPASAWNAAQNAPGYATGGFIRGAGSGTSDSILARLSNGEYVIRSSAVRRYGLNFLNALNNMRLPKFATGGLVSRAVAPALAASSGGASNTPVVLDLGQLGQYTTSAQPDVADELVRMFRRAALQRGRR